MKRGKEVLGAISWCHWKHRAFENTKHIALKTVEWVCSSTSHYPGDVLFPLHPTAGDNKQHPHSLTEKRMLEKSILKPAKIPNKTQGQVYQHRPRVCPPCFVL